jgi:hypothetical protein
MSIAILNSSQQFKNVVVSLNKWNNYEHHSGLVVDIDSCKVLGKQDDNGTVKKLSLTDINTCKKYGLNRVSLKDIGDDVKNFIFNQSSKDEQKYDKDGKIDYEQKYDNDEKNEYEQKYYNDEKNYYEQKYDNDEKNYYEQKYEENFDEELAFELQKEEKNNLQDHLLACRLQEIQDYKLALRIQQNEKTQIKDSRLVKRIERIQKENSSVATEVRSDRVFRPVSQYWLDKCGKKMADGCYCKRVCVYEGYCWQHS